MFTSSAYTRAPRQKMHKPIERKNPRIFIVFSLPERRKKEKRSVHSQLEKKLTFFHFLKNVHLWLQFVSIENSDNATSTIQSLRIQLCRDTPSVCARFKHCFYVFVQRGVPSGVVVGKSSGHTEGQHQTRILRCLLFRTSAKSHPCC